MVCNLQEFPQAQPQELQPQNSCRKSSFSHLCVALHLVYPVNWFKPTCFLTPRSNSFSTRGANTPPPMLHTILRYVTTLSLPMGTGTHSLWGSALSSLLAPTSSPPFLLPTPFSRLLGCFSKLIVNAGGLSSHPPQFLPCFLGASHKAAKKRTNNNLPAWFETCLKMSSRFSNLILLEGWL